MAPLTAATPFFERTWALVDPKTGQGVEWFLQWLEKIVAQQASMVAVLNGILGVNVFTVATQPALGAGDAGYLGVVDAPYLHVVRWTGAVWTFLDGGNRFVGLFDAAPGSGWALMDGGVVNVLTLGATITEVPFTTPDLVGSPSYLKTAAAYSGALVAAAAPSLNNPANTGGSGALTTGTDSTNGIKIGHVTTPITVDVTGAGATNTAPRHPSDVLSDGHTHTVVDHTHPQTAVTANADGEPRRLALLPYYRL